jgi:hypothetical protein
VQEKKVKDPWVINIILPLASVLVGIIGALTGLVPVLQHKNSFRGMGG